MLLLHNVLLVLSWFLIITVLLPFVRNDYWIFRIFEYPRYQKFILCIVAFTGLLLINDHDNVFRKITIALLALSTAYLIYKIWPYTPFAKKEMKSVPAKNNQNQIKLYTANVYQDNTSYSKIIQQIKECDPDVILLLETDKRWERKMDVLTRDYSNCLKEPLGNTYGLLFYTRLEVVEGQIKYLVEKDVPSLEATLKLPSGQRVRVWGLHPKPPVPGEDNKSTAKDKELMKVAFKAQQEKLPVIIMGDLNDVAWSYVTELFRKTSGLLDPRRGRGFYSTFSANYWFMRFPLDYVFCSAHFGLIAMKRLKHNGSDHFPMFSHFEFHPVLEKVQPKPKVKSEEILEAAKKAKQPV
jgi:endonuclease/exonuclease/phosphatase (EEP) superfamily protein YafD